MRSPFRFAGMAAMMFAVCGPAWAEAIAPAGSGVSIDKIVVENGPAQTVKYFVKGGSAQLQAVVRRVQWAENELSVIEQLQLLKLDTVVNERRVAAFRTTQLTNPYYSPGFIPVSGDFDNGSDGESRLQKSLARQLASEATPQAALQMIGLLEQVQTELDAQLKALPPQEKKAVQGPIDALRPRVDALPRPDVPPRGPQAAAPQPQVVDPVQADLPQLSLTLDPIPFKQIEVKWGQTWWPAEILQAAGGKYRIHYTGYAASWDEWVGKDRMRTR